MLVGKYYVIICILEKLLAWEAINNLGRSKKLACQSTQDYTKLQDL